MNGKGCGAVQFAGINLITMKHLGFLLLFFSPIWAIAQDDDSTSTNDSSTDTVKVERTEWSVDYGIEPESNLSVYSDLTGISDDQPNGLLQTEATISFPINTKAFHVSRTEDWSNYSAGDTVPDKMTRLFYFRNMVLGDFVLAKLEDNNRDLPLRLFHSPATSADSIYGLNTLDLVQYANFKYTAKVNLFTGQFFSHVEGCKHTAKPYKSATKGCHDRLKADDLYCRRHTIYLDAIGRFMRNSVADTNVVFSSSTNNTYFNTQGYGWNLKWDFQQHGQRLGLQAYWQGIYLIPNRPRRYILDSGTEIDAVMINNNNILASGPYRELETGSLQNKFVSELSIQVSLDGEDDNDDMKFLRLSFHGDGIFPGTGNNFFFQAQLGIAGSIDELFKKDDN